MAVISKIISKNLFAALAVVTTLFIVSCEKKIPSIPVSDISNIPSVTVKDFESVVLDSGKLQLILTSSFLEQYENETNPYSEFKTGILVVFYDGNIDPVGSVSSKYAKFTKADNTWELKDSVVVINENNDKLETELLYWDQEKDLIFTDRFVKITNEDQIIQGSGFEADSHLNNRVIKKVWAIIYIPDEE